MKRAQLILEDWQHEWLSAEAAKQNISMSALLRKLITRAIETSQIESVEDDPVWGIIGMAAGPEDGVTSENLDEFLYQNHWSAPSHVVAAEPGPDYH